MNEVKKALEVGDKQKAFALLRHHLAANPKDANAWLWMSEATTNPKQQVDALERVLRLAPQHPYAAAIRQRLEKLTKKPSTASQESKSRQVSTGVPVHSPPATQPVKPSIPNVPSAPAISEAIKTPAKAIEYKEKPASFTSTPPPAAQQRLGIREEARSREQLASAPPAHQAVQDLRQSLMGGAPIITEEEKSQEPSLASPPKAPSEQGLPKWVWLIILVAIVGLSGFLWIAYNMVQAN